MVHRSLSGARAVPGGPQVMPPVTMMVMLPGSPPGSSDWSLTQHFSPFPHGTTIFPLPSLANRPAPRWAAFWPQRLPAPHLFFSSVHSLPFHPGLPGPWACRLSLALLAGYLPQRRPAVLTCVWRGLCSIHSSRAPVKMAGVRKSTLYRTCIAYTGAYKAPTPGSFLGGWHNKK